MPTTSPPSSTAPRTRPAPQRRRCHRRPRRRSTAGSGADAVALNRSASRSSRPGSCWNSSSIGRDPLSLGRTRPGIRAGARIRLRIRGGVRDPKTTGKRRPAACQA